MTTQLCRAAASLAIVGMAAFTGALVSAQRSDTEGLKETENFVKAGGQTTQAVGEAKLSVKNTLDAYNTLLGQQSKDMKGDYKKLLKAVKEMDDKGAVARERVDHMQGVGNTYFAGRVATNKTIQDPALRQQAGDRLEANQKQHAEVLTQLRQAGDALAPFRKELADQINYLGSDLTPSAVTSLKPRADKLNERSGGVFKEIDEAINAANNYFNGMRPTKS